MKKLFIVSTILIVSIVTATCFFGCDKSKNTYTTGEFGILDADDPIIEFTFSTGDTIRAELYKKTAPISVENFLKYVKDGFYEGVVFHRIIKDFMIQTGGFEVKNGYFTEKDSTYPAIYGEFSDNGCTYNNVEHLKGVLSMARTNVKDSATSQFFFCSVDNYPTLNGSYAAFGRVIDEESMAVIDKFNNIATTTGVLVYGDMGYYSSDVPTQTISITKIKIIKE
ncbi:MAG: peptidylprolyl isomerase [Clostridia bacterium]|nr:peptidylprolyl isomerase [Clostridia bacterium]